VHGAVRVVAKEEGKEGGVGEGVGLRYALEGGEEYELLVALPPEFGVAEARSFVWTFELPLTRIGDVHPGAGVTVRHEGRVLDLGGGFSHF
jgi:thiamine-monophosphate kinase